MTNLEKPAGAATPRGPEEARLQEDSAVPDMGGQPFSVDAWPDATVAVKFLAAMHGDKPWCLSAIEPDGPGIETRTFVSGPDRDADVRAWVLQHEGRWNLYWQVNPPLRAINKKLNRANIKEVAFLHVDCDPRVGEPLADEQQRLRLLASTNLPAGVPLPTCTVWSGGGIHLFWKLVTPIPVNGDVTLADEAARYNKWLELAFGADKCHDVSRLLRLPGTTNVPDEGKRKKGRQRASAFVMDMDLTRTYPAADFKQTPARRLTPQMGATPTISANLPRIDLDDLPDKVTQRTKMLIVQGTDPDDPGKYPSQSEVVFAVCCEMVRAGCTDDQIAAVLLDRDFAISGHIYRQARPQDYAARQIKRAKDDAISPELRQLNDEHFVILNEGGKCRVCEWITEDEHQRKRLSFQSFDDFRNRYMNVKVDSGAVKDDKPVLVQLGKFWLGHSLRRQYKRLVFKPGYEEEIEGSLNLWQGWGIQPKLGSWPLLKAHVVGVLANGDPEYATYILRWTAWALQNPGEPAEVAMVFKGKSGTGKGTWARTIRKAFGQHGMQVTSHQHFAGRFNGHLRDVCLLFADEAVMPGDKSAEKILFGMLTEDELTIEGKGRDAITSPNHVKVIMASNEKWVVPANMQDRRFAVFQVSEFYMKDEAYFSALNIEIDSGGAAAMLHDLLAMPLGDWHPRRNIPNTAARNEQKLASAKGFESVFHDILASGDIPVGSPKDAGCWFVGTKAMQTYCNEAFRAFFTFNDIADLFRELGFTKIDKRPRGYLLPSLGEARSAWDRNMAPATWDAATEWEQTV